MPYNAVCNYYYSLTYIKASMLCYGTYLLCYTAHLYICVYIYNVAPEDGLESPKHVEQLKIKTSYKNLCILLVHFHISV